jgi:hypothetical protein
VFHWNNEENRFEVVKVNGDGRENYETRSDGRLFSGLVSEKSYAFYWSTDAGCFIGPSLIVFMDSES